MTKSAAGVACGLILDSNPDSGNIQRYQILSDLSVNHLYLQKHTHAHSWLLL